MSKSATQGENQDKAMMAHVVWLYDIDHYDSEAVGGKVARLGELLAADFPVPDAFCVTSSAYNEHVLLSDRMDLQDLVAKGQFADIYRRVRQVELDQAFVTDLLAKYRQLIARHPATVAVRSSSTAEDMAQYSFAGLYKTVLNVENELALLEAVRCCWASYWSEKAVLYREQVRLNHTQHAMAVLVQTMVQPKLAGVLFTRDPLHQEQNVMIVEFVHGSGESLVSGEAKGERLLIDREARRALPSSHSETRLDPSFLHRLVSLGLGVEQHQGGPQDIEWCVDEADHLWVLQTRPITGMAEVQPTPHIDFATGWQRYYDEPFSPLGCDLAVRRHGYWVRAINDYYKTSFEPEIEDVEGFLYYKASWRSPGSLLRLWMLFWKLFRWLRAGQIHEHYLKTVLPNHRERLAEIEPQNVTSLDTTALLARLNASIEMYLELQYTSYPIIEIAKTSVSMLAWLCRHWLGRDGNLRVSDFLSGLDNLTIERDLSLYRLGQVLREVVTPDQLENVDYAGFVALKGMGRAGRRFWDELQAFLDRYGYVWADRYPRDPAWEIDQDAMVASLTHIAGAAAISGLPQEHVQQNQRRSQAIERAAQQLSSRDWLSLRWLVFRWFLQRAQRFFPDKENRNHDVYQVVMVIRKYTREIGRRLKVQQVLQLEEDVFFLTWGEIQEALSGDIAVPQLRRWVERRKHVYRLSKRQRAEQEGKVRPDTLSPLGDTEVPRIELTGEPCSPGVAAGPTCLVNGLGELQLVQPGDIVVCRNMRPAWSPVFARAGGVVIEVGSVLSHGATLAREYGVPAVVNIPGIMQMVREGDRLTVDGHLGRVTIERAASHVRS